MADGEPFSGRLPPFSAMSTSRAATSSLLPTEWQVRLPLFEGPLDLLLHLTRISEVDITDIPVALVCDQFHAYLGLMDELSLDIAGEYIFMAAYLIHLKSKLLLPQQKDLDGVPIEEEDPRDDLVARLLEFRKLKDAAQTLAEVDSVRRGMWPRRSDDLQAIVKADPASLDLGDLSLFDLLSTFRTVLDRFERSRPEPLHLIGETFSVRAQLDRLLARLDCGRPFDLLDDLRALSGRREAIAAFLAVLEMARMSLVRVHQTDTGSVLLYRTTRVIEVQELEAIQG